MQVIFGLWKKPEGKIYFIAGIIYLLLALFAKGVNGGADTYTHYQMARYSWSHHELFLNQWGKPVFTVLFSPVAQFGLKAVIWTNIALIFFESFLLFKIVKLLNLKRPWLAPLLFLSCPVVFDNAISSLTEITCALFLILFIYWVLKKRCFGAALILSFMPFIRSEGFVIIGIAFVFFFVSHRWKFIPVLTVGSLIMNAIGYWYTGYPFWIFESNPYVNTQITSYGSGSFFHFFVWSIPVFGLGFLFVLKYTWEAALGARNRVKSDWLSSVLGEESKSFILNHQVLFWIILGSFWGYFMAHTILWWLGMWASLGLVRVMFVIAAPMVIIAAIEINKLLDKKPACGKFKSKHIMIGSLCFVAIATNTMILGALGFPLDHGVEESVFVEMSEWMKTEKITTSGKIFTGHSYVSVALDVDPFDQKKMQQIQSLQFAKKGDLIVWDGHFGPNEDGIPIEVLDSDTTLTFLKEFRPDREYRPLNDMPFYVRLYQKNR